MDETTMRFVTNSTDVLENKLQTAEEVYKKWRHWGIASRTVRGVSWLVIIAATIIACIYFRHQGTTWFYTVLFGLVAIAICVTVVGLVVLLLKPLFSSRRKKAKNEHELLTEIENEMMMLELAGAYQSVSAYFESESQENDIKTNKFNMQKNFRRYEKTIQQIYFSSCQLRELEMEKERWSEWCWVISAAMTIIAVIAAAIAFFVLAVLVVLVVAFWIIFHSSNDSYTYDDFDIKNDDDGETLFGITVDAFHGRVEKIDKAITETHLAISMMVSKREELRQKFLKNGIYLPATKKLPYLE